MKEIPLTKGKFALVDDKDFRALAIHSWYYNDVNPHGGYAKNQSLGYMHRVIMNVPDGKEVDHLNGNTIDNQRKNLRFATRAEQNRNKHNGVGKSKYKGVAWEKLHEAWLARIRVNGKLIYLGQFRDELKAAQAYNDAAPRYFGEFGN